MKLKKFLYIGLNNFFKNKNNLFNIIFMTLPLIVMIVSCSIYKTFNVFINNDNLNNILHRVLFVYSNEDTSVMVNKLEDIKEISQVSNSLNFTSGGYVKEFLSNDFTGEIFIYGLNERNLPKISSGSIEKYTKNTDNTIYIVCPSIIYPDTSILDDKNWKKRNGINTKNFFEKSLNLTRKNSQKSISIEIVATYDTKENNASQYQCYSTPESSSKINNFFGENKVQENFAVVVVDKFTNINKVQKKILNLGYESSTIQDDMTSFANNILKTGIYVFFIIFLISFLLIYVSYSKSLLKKNKEIYLFRIIGYSKKITSLIFNVECFFTGLFSWIFAVIISLIIILLYGVYLHSLSIGNSNINILFSYKSLVFTFIFSIVLPIIIFQLNFLIKKGSLIENIKENN